MEFFSIFSGIISIIGFLGLGNMIFVTNKNISKILEHSTEILFGYYSKMKVYLLELKITLGQEDETPLTATLVDSDISEEDESVKKLQETVDKIIDFFKTQDWQIPLDFNFENSLSELMVELMYLEKGNLCQFNSSIENVKEKYNKLIKLIDTLIKKITEEQNDIAEKAKESQESILQKIKKHVC